MRLEIYRVVDVAEVADPEGNHFVRDHEHHQEVNHNGCPTEDGAYFAGAFFLIILMKATQGFVELAAHFAGGVLAGKYIGKNTAGTDNFGRCVAAVDERTPGEHGATN